MAGSRPIREATWELTGRGGGYESRGGRWSRSPIVVGWEIKHLIGGTRVRNLREPHGQGTWLRRDIT